MEVIPYGVGARPAPRVIIVPFEQGGEPIFRNGMASVQADEEQESVSTQATHAPVWADNLPSVSFDIKLGEYFESVGFDVDEFRALADEYGMDDKTRRDISINITSKKNMNHRGYYMPDDKSISVRNLRKLSRTNQVLAHELKHAADDAEGILEVQVPRYIIGQLGLRAMKYAIGGMYVRNGIDMAVDLPVSTAYASLGAYFLCLGAGIWGYRLHPTERRAFGTKKQARDIITMTERSVSKAPVSENSII